MVQVEYTLTAVDIIETLLGFMHPETAEVYTQTALQYQEMEEMPMAEDAAPYIRKAFVIHMSLFGKDHELTQHTYRLLQGIEISVGSGLEVRSSCVFFLYLQTSAEVLTCCVPGRIYERTYFSN